MSRPPTRFARRQRGVFALMLAPLLLGLVLCMGVVLDMAQVYNRRTELQSVADGAALAAARALDGTPDGFTAARTAARSVVEANRYAYGQRGVTWDDAALRFAGAPDAGDQDWVDAASAPATHGFAKVDSARLVAANRVSTLFMQAVDADVTGRDVAVQAVAGRTAINVAPLAICAMGAASTTRLSGALSERVEYGFRRGVGYNLLDLNPSGAVALSYVINPLATPPAASHPANFLPAVLNPFMCGGSMPMAALPATVHVSPISAAGFDFVAQLNSRFGPSGACDPAVGVADTNVRQYTPAATNWWGGTAPPAPPAWARQTAAPTAAGQSPRRTKADVLMSATEIVTAADYGPLWAYSRPLSSSGATFAPADWPALYPVNSGGPSAASSSGANRYPLSGTPYPITIGTWYTASSTLQPRLAGRRVLNVVLLDCPVGAGAAAVLAVGRFFMTAQATASAISGEFAGVAPPATLGGPVGLYQ